MLDLVYILLTCVSFVGLALLVGVIDRRLPPPEAPAGATESESADAAKTLAGAR